ncbi:uncharacterized protein [Haliaeetus albicilla]|uniref:uncharacterized protein n=1 Tax=Haliaeetus albicilla TaxID=8969 RepID=UPI0037E7FA93
MTIFSFCIPLPCFSFFSFVLCPSVVLPSSIFSFQLSALLPILLFFSPSLCPAHCPFLSVFFSPLPCVSVFLCILVSCTLFLSVSVPLSWSPNGSLFLSIPPSFFLSLFFSLYPSSLLSVAIFSFYIYISLSFFLFSSFLLFLLSVPICVFSSLHLAVLLPFFLSFSPTVLVAIPLFPSLIICSNPPLPPRPSLSPAPFSGLFLSVLFSVSLSPTCFLNASVGLCVPISSFSITVFSPSPSLCPDLHPPLLFSPPVLFPFFVSVCPAPRPFSCSIPVSCSLTLLPCFSVLPPPRPFSLSCSLLLFILSLSFLSHGFSLYLSVLLPAPIFFLLPLSYCSSQFFSSISVLFPVLIFVSLSFLLSLFLSTPLSLLLLSPALASLRDLTHSLRDRRALLQ